MSGTITAALAAGRQTHRLLLRRVVVPETTARSDNDVGQWHYHGVKDDTHKSPRLLRFSPRLGPEWLKAFSVISTYTS